MGQFDALTKILENLFYHFREGVVVILWTVFEGFEKHVGEDQLLNIPSMIISLQILQHKKNFHVFNFFVEFFHSEHFRINFFTLFVRSRSFEHNTEYPPKSSRTSIMKKLTFNSCKLKLTD